MDMVQWVYCSFHYGVRSGGNPETSPLLLYIHLSHQVAGKSYLYNTQWEVGTCTHCTMHNDRSHRWKNTQSDPSLPRKTKILFGVIFQKSNMRLRLLLIHIYSSYFTPTCYFISSNILIAGLIIGVTLFINHQQEPRKSHRGPRLTHPVE